MPMGTITVAGINPGLKILGNTQQFNYNQPLSLFQITNDFIPTVSIPSQFNQEIRNTFLSGFRWIHLTNYTDTYGSFKLQSFVNAQSTGSDIIKFDSAGINIFKTINLNDQPGISGQVLTSQGAGTPPIWTNNISGVLASIHIIDNTSNATNITANTFTKVLGTTHPGPLNNFIDVGNNQLKYTGLDTIITMVSIDLTVIPTSSSTLAISIYKNNTTFIPGTNYNYQSTGLKPTSLKLSLPIEFSTNDYIEIYITSDIDDSGVMVSQMNLVITC